MQHRLEDIPPRTVAGPAIRVNRVGRPTRARERRTSKKIAVWMSRFADRLRIYEQGPERAKRRGRCHDHDAGAATGPATGVQPRAARRPRATIRCTVAVAGVAWAAAVQAQTGSRVDLEFGAGPLAVRPGFRDGCDRLGERPFSFQGLMNLIELQEDVQVIHADQIVRGRAVFWNGSTSNASQTGGATP